ncbi:hypothetical protein NT03LS_2682 [Listeria seeligeri FSL N1-067]|uniref:Uncharacterized protein n=1 Tax=Listeria seeligeri FSL N1-067 TaxID=702453 RepID=E3ZT36_LISSE|nr:hypothetical protein NT03LS_2682 [Listeria seeligeri FSL N1-067]
MKSTPYKLSAVLSNKSEVAFKIDYVVRFPLALANKQQEN